MSNRPTVPPESPPADAVAQRLPFELDHLAALQRMEILESYYRWTFERVRPWLGRRCLDAGAGIGSFTALLEPCTEQVTALELSPENLTRLRRRFADSPVVDVAAADLTRPLPDLGGAFDTVVCLDVLEHLEDDRRLLERLRGVTRPRGHLVLKVPACRWLFGAVDVASGHYRRYSPSLLRRRAQAVGWRVERIRYMNIWGVLPYLVKSRVLRRRANFSHTFSPRQLRILASVTPWLSWLDRLVGPPVGLSLLLAAGNPGP